MTTLSARPKSSPRPSGWSELPQFMTGAAVAVLCCSVLLGFLPEARLGVLDWLVAYLPALILAPAVHEAGHLIGGRLAGFRAALFVLGPLRVERTAGGIRAGLNRSLALYGGTAASVPEDTHDLRRRTLLMIAGGPATSILSGVLALALREPLGLAAIPAAAGHAHVIASTATAVFGVMSLLLGVVTLIPSRAGGPHTDGRRILQLLRSGPAADRDVALFALWGQTLAGRRPREWDPDLVAQALAPADGTQFDVIARQLASVYALDRGEPGEARRHLAGALGLEETLPPLARPGLLVQAAYFAAVVDGDAVRARALFSRAGSRLTGAPHQRLLAEAAVCLAEGDARLAAGLLDRAEAQLGRAPGRGAAVMDLEHIRRLRAAAMRVPAGPAPSTA